MPSDRAAQPHAERLYGLPARQKLIVPKTKKQSRIYSSKLNKKRKGMLSPKNDQQMLRRDQALGLRKTRVADVENSTLREN